MPVRNGASTLTSCLDSIASQQFHDYEIVVVNDGSNDQTLELLTQRSIQDRRINIFSIPSSGIVAALTLGLSKVRGQYVARMDADDIMHPERIGKQFDYLQQNSQVDLVACCVNLFPEYKVKGGYHEYIRWQNDCVSHDDIYHEMYVESPLAHPSVMFLKKSIDEMGGYRDGDFPEDYDMWLRMAAQGCRFHKLSETLLAWRESGDRASRVDSRYSREAFDRLRAYYLAKDPRLDSERPLIIWGAGRQTRKRAAHLFQYGFVPSLWIDVDPRKIGNKINGVSVASPELLSSMALDNKPFVLCYVNNHGARQLIRDYLNTYGYVRGVDFLMVG